MRQVFLTLALGSTLSAAASAAPTLFHATSGHPSASTKVIFDQSYHVPARMPFQTGYVAVLDAPVATTRIVLKQAGAGCNLAAYGVKYLNNIRVGEQNAIHTGTGTTYAIPDGQIGAINMLLEHQGPFAATCRITVEAQVEGDSGDDDWTDWETADSFSILAEWGRDPQRVGPFTVADLVKGVRLFIPRACGDIELVDSAMEIDGQWREFSGQSFSMTRTNDEKTFSLKFSSITELNQIAFRIRAKRRDCRADVQVVYY